MVKTKLVKAAGRFGVRYGQMVKRRIASIEEKQNKRQPCIFCKGSVKRLSKGIWECKKCGKKFAEHAYYIERAAEYESSKTNTQGKTLKKQETPVKVTNKKQKNSKK